jgi:aminopeptidase-like protein
MPGTIGSMTWVALNEGRVQNIKHGLVLSGLGDAGGHTYKRSRRGDSEIDRAAEHVLRHSDDGHAVVDFTPYGYDERQYCSQGFNLAVGNLSRTPFGQYPEYHTSGDNLDFIREESLTGSLEVLLKIVDVLEGNRRYRNLKPKGEPQLGRRGLYDSIGGRADTQALQMALLWVLNFSDGDHSLLDIAGRAGVPFALMREAADALEAQGLLEAL